MSRAGEDAPVQDSLLGRSTSLAVSLSAEDVASFGRLTRDDHPIHVDEIFARRVGLPGCIVQGSLMVGLMAGASTRFFTEHNRPALSYGYDRIRFTGQTPVGSRVLVDYVMVEEDAATGKLWADVTVKNDDGKLWEWLATSRSSSMGRDRICFDIRREAPCHKWSAMVDLEVHRGCS